MKYTEYLNGLIRKRVAENDNLVVFGQNINAGSCLGGLTRGMTVKPNSRVINSTNSENSLVGFGFGLMMNGAKGIFFMKQMDFLLLGVDQLVNTYNIIRSARQQPKEGSFTIVATVVDSGFEGPQSSLNNFADFCSIARIPGFAVTNKTDADYIFENHFARPGFRIIGLSQRLGKTEIINPVVVRIENDGALFQYSNGKDVTLVSFNFSFTYAHELVTNLKNHSIDATHFNVNLAIATDWTLIVKSALATKKIIVLDDSKSTHIPADSFLSALCGKEVTKKIVIKRELSENWLYPVSDVFEIDIDRVIKELK